MSVDIDSSLMRSTRGVECHCISAPKEPKFPAVWYSIYTLRSLAERCDFDCTEIIDALLKRWSAR